MTVEVPDPRRIAARNEGAFPVTDIFAIIDGPIGIRGHGYPMSVRGARFDAEQAETLGPIPSIVTHARILELTYDLHSIRE